MTEIETLFNSNKNKCSDINEHLQTLFNYAKQVDHITELGTRWGDSTSAFLAASPKKLISYDLYRDNIISIFEKNNNFEFKQNDTLKIKIECTELLFIDTLHTYFQLYSELNLHSENVSKFIILHDTESFGLNDEALYGSDFLVKMSDMHMSTEKKGLKQAINDFLITEKGNHWQIEKIFTNNNGLTILSRKNNLNTSNYSI